MTLGRDAAWSEAEKMAALSPSEMPAAIADLDQRTQLLGRLVVSPPILIKAQLLPIRLRETNNVRRVLDVLAS